jgi:hypothetical protein
MTTVTEDNFVALVDLLREREPFRPFTVELKSGMLLEVDHPGAIDVASGFAVYTAPGSVPIMFDHECVSHVFGCLVVDIPDLPGR